MDTISHLPDYSDPAPAMAREIGASRRALCSTGGLCEPSLGLTGVLNEKI